MTDEAPPVRYAVRCPNCREQAVAVMVPVGVRGTYRESLVNVQAEQDEVGDLAGAIGLVTLLERSGYVVRRRRRRALWSLRIRGHGDSWYATGKTAVEALEAAGAEDGPLRTRPRAPPRRRR
jgi:hypothetical protein